jgi:hypothetical protein
MALGVCAVFQPVRGADELLRFNHNVPGDSKPIVVHADYMATWIEAGQRVLLARGHVEVEHGVFLAHLGDGVLWIDQEGFRRSGVLRVEMYAEGKVSVENGSETRSADRALINLTTRGEVKLRAHKAKVAQEIHQEDDVYRRGVEARREPASPTIAPNMQSSVRHKMPLIRVARAQAPDPTPAAPGSTSAQPQVQTPAPVDTPQTSPPANAPIGSQPAPPPSTLTPGPPPPQRPQIGPAPAPGPPKVIVPPRDRSFRSVAVVGRTAAGYQTQSQLLSNGETATLYTGGVIILVRTADPTYLFDIEADYCVTWTRGSPQEFMNRARTPESQEAKEVEFYLTGNVEIRDQNGPEAHTIRADEVYYNVSRHTAVALRMDAEFRRKGVADPIHMRGEEMQQLGEGLFRGLRVQISSSRLPSDPGLDLFIADATLEQKDVPKRNIFGMQFYDRRTGEPEVEHQVLIDGHNVFVDLERFPIFWLPYVRGDANDPLGPLESAAFNYDRMFGFQFRTTWNMYNLLGIEPLPDTHWKLEADYLTERGPALGQFFEYQSRSFFGLPAQVMGDVRAYGIYDTGTDILGGFRNGEPHTDWRGRLLWKDNVQSLPYGFSLQSQVAWISDKNFLEEYYKLEFDNDPNQETFIYLKQQQTNWAWTLLTEQRIRDWMTETSWLPKADGYLIGQSIFDVFSYNAHVSAGYGHLQPTSEPPPPTESTDKDVIAGRFDAYQELSLPFSLGPFRLAPYANLDLAYYTKDLEGEDRGRVYGGGGVRGSIPFTRLYPDVQSDLLNLNAINHKIVLSANFYAAKSDTTFRDLPQMDQLNDNASDQSLRDIKRLEPIYNPQNGLFLATSPLFDPQLYAIRTLVDNRVDTLDTIEVLQMDIRQRLQTKRGYPGQEHITDWMTLDVSASYYPHSERDNFGESFSFFQYDYNWNVGDRTAIFSNGWFEPHHDGPHVFGVGALLNRTDRTQFFIGYRQIDPLESKAITAAVSYVMSPKYSLTFGVTYDFGVNTQINSLYLTRYGSDLQLNLGFTYNSILNTFGVTFVIIPNILPATQHIPGLASFGQGGLIGAH